MYLGHHLASGDGAEALACGVDGMASLYRTPSSPHPPLAVLRSPQSPDAAGDGNWSYSVCYRTARRVRDRE